MKQPAKQKVYHKCGLCSHCQPLPEFKSNDGTILIGQCEISKHGELMWVNKDCNLYDEK